MALFMISYIDESGIIRTQVNVESTKAHIESLGFEILQWRQLTDKEVRDYARGA